MYFTKGARTLELNRMISSGGDDQDEACENGEALGTHLCVSVSVNGGGECRGS